MPKRLVVQYRGDLGSPPSNFAMSMIEDPTDDAAAAVFLTALEAHTEANISKRVFLETTSMTATAPGTDVNVDRKAILYFRHPTTLRTHNFTITSIAAADVEEIAGSTGERVKSSAMTAIVADIATLTGVSYTPLYGVVVQGR